MWKKNETGTRQTVRRLLLLLGCCGLAASTGAQTGLPGDVNLDGAINVLDVQASINMALGVSDNAPEADADLNEAVDVRDVQALVNTALGLGGLVQPVIGNVPPERNSAGAKIIAVSLDGRTEEAQIDPDTGSFELLLGVRTAWSLALFGAEAGASTTLATLSFPIAGAATAALPAPSLSSGVPMELGEVLATIGGECAWDIRTLIARSGQPLPAVDINADGLPDLIESLIGPYIDDPTLLGITVPADLDLDVLGDYVRDCFDTIGIAELYPDLTGAEIDGIPGFLDPSVQCVFSGVAKWLNSGAFTIPQQLIDIYNGHITKWLAEQVGPWLTALAVPELQDANGDWVPDFIEGFLCPAGDCELDTDGDGIPDFAQDADGDGVPNLFDRDAASESDIDGDGIPNEFDVDDDGDGVPDYADAEPANPQIA